ncbi:MAG: hypothetical protein FWH11_06880 [Micrococcales bacterium]|nr:hypothetical protein [Micrococcales bacterium]
MQPSMFVVAVTIGIIAVVVATTGGLAAAAVQLTKRRLPAGSQGSEPDVLAARARQHDRTITALAWWWLPVGSVAGAVVSGIYQGWAFNQDGMIDGQPLGSDLGRDIVGWIGDGTLGLVLAPLVIGTGFLAIHSVGERTWPRPTGSTRHAVLEPRSVRALVGPALPAWGTALVGALLAVLFAGAIAADPRDSTGIVVDSCGQGCVAGNGMWPGAFYGVALLVALAALGTLTGLVLRAIARRPAVAGTTQADDVTLRQTATRRVLGVVQLVVGLTLAAALMSMGDGLWLKGRPGQEWIDAVAYEVPSNDAVATLGVGVMLLGIVVLLASLATMVRSIRPTSLRTRKAWIVMLACGLLAALGAAAWLMAQGNSVEPDPTSVVPSTSDSSPAVEATP